MATDITQQSEGWQEIYQRSLEQPEELWAEAAAEIDWVEPWDQVLDGSRAPFYRWFPWGPAEHLLQRARSPRRRRPGGQARADLRLAGHGFEGERHLPRELRDAVARFAGALVEQGVGSGDRVIIYMRMVPEAAIANEL